MFYTAWREVDGRETSKWPKLQYTSYNCAWPVVCRINIVWHLMLNLKKGLILVRHSKHCTSTQVHIKIQWKQRFERWGVDVRRRQSQGRLALYLRTSPTGTLRLYSDWQKRVKNASSLFFPVSLLHLCSGVVGAVAEASGGKKKPKTIVQQKIEPGIGFYHDSIQCHSVTKCIGQPTASVHFV